MREGISKNNFSEFNNFHPVTKALSLVKQILVGLQKQF